MLELTGAGAALLVGVLIGFVLARRRRAGGRMFYAEWGSTEEHPASPGDGNRRPPNTPSPGDEDQPPQP